tara:strand:- start:1024 stop:1893 length:870 start_codon:yes stop_codon:yes gene_type:complete
LISSDFLDLSDTTSIITGGAGMLGRQYTAALLQCGSQVIILDNKSSKTNVINNLKKESKLDENLLSNLTLIKCDITNHNQVKKTFTSLRSSLKNLKILVNNASLVKQVKKNSDLINVYKPFLKMLPKDWEEYFSIDLTGTLLVTQQSIPYMQKNGGGSIINISSTYGILSPDQSLYEHFNKKLTTKQKKMGIVIEKPIGYSISKSGILNLTRFIATKFTQDNIRVNTLTLGGVYDENPSQFVKAYSKKTPLNRMARKQEYIGPLLFLASNMSSYMTGSNLIVDGGWSAW